MSKQTKDENSCIFNPIGIECSKENRRCNSCGWNPAVELERKRQIRGRVYAGEPIHCTVK